MQGDKTMTQNEINEIISTIEDETMLKFILDFILALLNEWH